MRNLVVIGSALVAAGTIFPSASASAFPSGGTADYQLGQSYSPPAGVTVVVRDSTDSPAAGLYNICYINGFQTQPGDSERFEGLTLFADPDWPDELILDTSTPENRDALLALISPAIQSCADKGFQAVEFDNLDSFTRSHGLLTAEDNFAFASQLVAVAHGAGLQAGQKNAAEHTASGKNAGFDFAVAEECAQYDECGSYTSAYGSQVIDVEYTDNLETSFDDVCAGADRPRMTILRDRYLVVPGNADYVYDRC